VKERGVPSGYYCPLLKDKLATDHTDSHRQTKAFYLVDFAEEKTSIASRFKIMKYMRCVLS